MTQTAGLAGDSARTPASRERHGRTALWLFLAALVVRIIYSLLRDVGNPIPPGTDAISYDAFARAILSGTGWITNPGPELFRPPGYPMVLAVLYALTGGHLGIVQLLQSLVGAGSVVLVYELGRRHLDARTALISAVWLLLNPLHLDYNGKLLRETWLVFLNVALLFSILAKDGRKAAGVIRTALLMAILVHFDSRYVFHLPFFAVYYAITLGVRAAVRPVLLFAAAVVVFSAPWAIRNEVAYDRFVLIDPRTLDRWTRRAGTSLAGDRLDPADQLAAFETRKRAGFDTLSAVERAAFAAGVRPGHGQPTKAIYNFTEFWRIFHLKSEYRPFPDARFGPPWSVEHNVASLLFMGLLLPAFLAGAWRSVAAGDRVGLLLLAFIAVHTLLHVLVHSVVRYRLPIEPFYALIAFQEIVRWTSKAPRKVKESEVPREPRVEVAV